MEPKVKPANNLSRLGCLECINFYGIRTSDSTYLNVSYQCIK